MTALATIGDTLQNLIVGLGVGSAKSKLSGDQFAFQAVSINELEAMYRADWIARKAVDAPVVDATRGWRQWQASADQITAIEAAEKRHQIRSKVVKAMKWARLYGGAAILIGDGAARPEQPLIPETMKRGGIKYLTVLTPLECRPHELDDNPASPTFRQPRHYAISNTSAMNVHPSRVIPILGPERPGIASNTDGWGDSVLQVIRDALHQFALSATAGAELMHEAKIDVIRIDNLGAQLANTAGSDALLRRFTAANMLKGINGMLLLDKTEEWERKQTTFSGIPEVIRLYLELVAGATDIPVTRLAGQSPKGLGGSGSHEERNYYDMIEGIRTDTLQSVLDRLDPLLWRDELGSVPSQAWYEFPPLWQPTEVEKATVAKTKAETTKLYFDMGLLPDDMLAVGVANQLIEDGVYPGVEDELAAVQSASNGAREDTPQDDDPTGSGL